MTPAEKERILSEARETLRSKLDAGAHDDDGLARWNALRKAHQEPESSGGAAMAAPEPAPAPVINSAAWNAWWDANYAAAQAQQSEISPFLTQLLGEVLGHERHKFDKALARERRCFELAIAKLRTELCRLVSDTVVRIESVVTAERVARAAERDIGAGEPPDKPLN